MSVQNRVESVVFLVAWPISQWHANRWGFEIFRNQGIKVIVLDLSSLVNGLALSKQPNDNFFEADFIHTVTSYFEFEKELKHFASSSIFIDYILGVSDIDWKHEKIFRLLHKWRAKYFVISAGQLPTCCPVGQRTSSIRWVISRIMRVQRFSQLLDFIFRKTVVLLRRNDVFYGIPDKIFGCRSNALDVFLSKYNLSDSRWVPTHSLDYDTYLQYINGTDDEDLKKIEKREKRIVFIDEGLAGHCDWDILNINPLDAHGYSAELKKFFEWIENLTGARVVIAAHPRSPKDILESLFPGVEIVYGETIELTARGILIVAHYSTAVSFAVLFKKPLMLVKTTEMLKNSFLNSRVDEMAQELDIMPLVLSEETFKHQSILMPTISEEKYAIYAEQYVRSSGIPDRMLWDFVMDEIA